MWQKFTASAFRNALLIYRFFCGKCVFVYYKFMYSLVAEDLAFTDKLTRSQFAVLNAAMAEK